MQNGHPGSTLPIAIDRGSTVPPRQQVRAALLRLIAEGTLPVGAALPSVRDLAGATGLAPMTVTRIYAELKAAGLVAARPGSGTFVADSAVARPSARPAVAALRARIEALVDQGVELGLGGEDLVALVAAQALGRDRGPPRPAFVVVGLFPAATESYAARVAAQLGEAATVSSLVLGADPSAEARCLAAADLVITFPTLQARVLALAPGARVVRVRFIPAESTRMALAALDPMARVAVVSRFADFLPVLELGVRRFAPHVARVAAMDLEALPPGPDLARALAASDVIVMSTGAEAAGDLAPPDAVRIEYRHIPDPGDVERLVGPWTREPAARKEAS